MPYTIYVNLPNQADGAEVEIDGLGIYANGEIYPVSDEEAGQFLIKHQKTLLEADIAGVDVEEVVGKKVRHASSEDHKDDWSKSTVPELQEKLKSMDLPTDGLKADLIKRIEGGGDR